MQSVLYEQPRVLEAAQQILDQRGWCLYETCVDVPRQVWEPRVVIFGVTAEAVAEAVEDEIELDPEHDARLSGLDRRTLSPAPEMGTYLCYLAGPAPRCDPLRTP
jgi:hypothetical protein